MFERCTEPLRRAIFFATFHARLGETAHIDSVHLLKALMWDENSRANTLFRLREHFPQHRTPPSKFATIKDVPEIETVLEEEAKRILRAALWEADMMGDYWIDTEHLVLGILKEPASAAAQYLAKTGLTLNQARRVVLENRRSRPDYGPLTPWWKLRSPVDNLISKLRLWGYRRGTE